MATNPVDPASSSNISAATPLPAQGANTASTGGSAQAPANTAATPQTSTLSPQDMVKLSQNAVAANLLASVGGVMGDFKSALVGTLSPYSSNSAMGSLYQLTGTPVDSFLTQTFSKMPPAQQQQFQSLFNSLASVQDGLVPSSLIQNTFGGSSGGFEQLLAAINSRMNQINQTATSAKSGTAAPASSKTNVVG